MGGLQALPGIEPRHSERQLLDDEITATAKLRTVAMDSLPQFARPEHYALYRSLFARVCRICLKLDFEHKSSCIIDLWPQKPY